MTSNVDDAITESVTQANVKKGSEAPAMAIDPHQGASPASDAEALRQMMEQRRRDAGPRG